MGKSKNDHSSDSDSSSSEEEVKSFRIRAKHLFLTYPQCPITPEEAFPLIKSIVGDVIEYYIGQHKHEHGAESKHGVHLHMYIHCESAFSTRKANKLDLLYQGVIYHGNYQTCRNPTKTVEYISSHELCHFSNLRLLQEEVLACKTVQEVRKLLICRKKVHQYKFWVDFFNESQPLYLITLSQYFLWWDQAKRHLLSLKSDLGRPKALFIYGPPETGKTSFVYYFKELLGSSIIITCPKQFMHYSNESCIVIDEFDKNKQEYSLAFLNNLITEPNCFTPSYYGSKKLIYPRLVLFLSNNPLTEFIASNPSFGSRLCLQQSDHLACDINDNYGFTMDPDCLDQIE